MRFNGLSDGEKEPLLTMRDVAQLYGMQPANVRRIFKKTGDSVEPAMRRAKGFYYRQSQILPWADANLTKANE